MEWKILEDNIEKAHTEKRTRSLARRWKPQFVTSWPYQIRVLFNSPHLVLWLNGMYLQPQFERYQWPRYWFYSSNSSRVHIFPRYVLWANSYLWCLHETSSGMYHWSPLTRDSRESCDWVPLSLDGVISYLLSAVCGQLSWSPSTRFSYRSCGTPLLHLPSTQFN